MNEIKARILEQFKTLSPPPRMTNDFHSIGDNDLTALIQSVDESGYSLNDWLFTLKEFYLWEEKSQRSLTLAHKIEYTHCCVEGAGSSTRLLPLVEVWADYIKIYGVE